VTDAWPLFDGLVAATGAVWDRHVLRALSGDVDALRARLEPLLDDPDWRRSATAWILLGRLDDPPQRRAVEVALDEVDVEWQRTTCGGLAVVIARFGRRAPREWGEAILPWAWEVVLKRARTWEGWRVDAAMHMIASVPHVRSVRPLIGLILYGSDLSDLAGLALGCMPPDVARGPIEAAAPRVKDQERLDLFRRALERLDARSSSSTPT
jgi:hypothetical protein